MSGLQGYYNTVNSFGSSLDSAQNYLSNYDTDYLNSTLPNFQAKVQEAKEKATGLLEAGATIEGTYVAAKALKATYSAVKKRLSKNDGDEDGTEDNENEDGIGEEATETDEVPEGDASGETGAETEVEPSVSAEAEPSASGPEETSGLDTTPVEAGDEDEITAQLQDEFSSGPEASVGSTAEEGGEASSSSGSGGQQYFSTEPEDEFDLPSGLGEAGDLSVGQDATTATRLADNPSMLTGERVGPELLGEQSGGGSSGITSEGANIDIPQITSGNQEAQSSAEEGAQTESEPSITAEPEQTSGQASEAEATSDTAQSTTETTSLAEGATDETAQIAGETAGEVATDTAVDVGASTALDTALGVASVASEAIPVVGGLVALGIGLFELFHHHSKPKPPPPPQQTTTQKGEVVVPSFDSVVDTPASASAF